MRRFWVRWWFLGIVELLFVLSLALPALGDWDGSVDIVDVASGERTQLDGQHTAAVQGVGFLPDGSTLVTTGDDRNAKKTGGRT